MSKINSPTQRERLRELPTPREAAEHLSDMDIRSIGRQILMAYSIGDLVQATEAESAYDVGFQDGQRASPRTEVDWCVEHNTTRVDDDTDKCWVRLAAWNKVECKFACAFVSVVVSTDPDDPAFVCDRMRQIVNTPLEPGPRDGGFRAGGEPA